MASDTESTLWSESWMQSGEGSGSGWSWGATGGGVAVGEGSGDGAVLPWATACEGPRLSVAGLRQLGINETRKRRTRVARRRFTPSFITSNRRGRHCPGRTGDSLLRLRRTRRAVEPGKPPAFRAERDQGGQPLEARLVLLRAHHKKGGEAPIPGGLRLEEGPGARVRAELALEGTAQCRVRALERLDARPLLVAPLERGEARRAHPPECLQLAHALDVDEAPVAARLARREALDVAALVHGLAHAVDPAEAECLVEGLPVGDARLAGALVEEADPQLGDGVVGLLEPGAELARRTEEPRRLGAPARAHARAAPASARSSRSLKRAGARPAGADADAPLRRPARPPRARQHASP